MPDANSRVSLGVLERFLAVLTGGLVEERGSFPLYSRDMTKTSRNRTVETVRTVIQPVKVVRTRWLPLDLNRKYRGTFNETA